MPNDCWNHVTVYAPTDFIQTLVSIKQRFFDLVAQPPAAIPEHEHFGSDRFYGYQVDQVGQEALQFRFVSAWKPPLRFFGLLLKEHPIHFLKVTWTVEDGSAGVMVGQRNKDGTHTMNSMTWDEGCLEEKAHRWRA
jgi:hypothetical protein